MNLIHSICGCSFGSDDDPNLRVPPRNVHTEVSRIIGHLAYKNIPSFTNYPSSKVYKSEELPKSEKTFSDTLGDELYSPSAPMLLDPFHITLSSLPTYIKVKDVIASIMKGEDINGNPFILFRYVDRIPDRGQPLHSPLSSTKPFDPEKIHIGILAYNSPQIDKSGRISDYMARLLKGEPCGHLHYNISTHQFHEGARTLADGRSVVQIV